MCLAPEKTRNTDNSEHNTGNNRNRSPTKIVSFRESIKQESKTCEDENSPCRIKSLEGKRLGVILWKNKNAEEKSNDSNRDIDVENPVPRKILCQKTSKCRTESHTDRREKNNNRKTFCALNSRHVSGKHCRPDNCHHDTSKCLNHTG